MHVMRHNHDTTYNKALSDSGIEHHVEYPSFESVFQDIDSFMEQHGRKCRTPKLIFHWSMLLVLNYHCFWTFIAIDIVIGGPPCQERRGTPGNAEQRVLVAQDSYLSKFVDLITRIKKEQRNHPLFYLVENTIIDNCDDIKQINNALGCPAVMFDAQHFSPTRRKRHYWCNVSF